MIQELRIKISFVLFYVQKKITNFKLKKQIFSRAALCGFIFKLIKYAAEVGGRGTHVFYLCLIHDIFANCKANLMFT